MKSLSNKNSTRYSAANSNSGMTLIEVIIYTVLLSLLLSGFIQYAFTVHMNDIELSHEIEDAYAD